MPGYNFQSVYMALEVLLIEWRRQRGEQRHAFRVFEEPLDTFRRDMAVYAREQADCPFSPTLIGNLERYRGAQSRKE
jgi:hypothetical protein